MSETLTPDSTVRVDGVGVAALHVIDGFERPNHDGLVSHQAVVNALLDLRNVLDGPGRTLIDHLLVTVPGVNVVDSNWWLDQIDALEDLFAGWDDAAS